MDTWAAFLKGEASRGKELMVFDWDKAAELIKEHGARNASAGLAGDWEYTGDVILVDGLPAENEYSQLFLASTWATPQLEIDGWLTDCYRMQSETPGWDSHTFWPESARTIMGFDSA